MLKLLGKQKQAFVKLRLPTYRKTSIKNELNYTFNTKILSPSDIITFVIRSAPIIYPLLAKLDNTLVVASSPYELLPKCPKGG